jgi:phage terminase small subunit
MTYRRSKAGQLVKAAIESKPVEPQRLKRHIATMARPRKPSAILELSGAFDHDPQRRRPNEPVDTRELGDPPDRLPAAAKKYWAELASQAVHGVLRYSDRWTVEIASRLMLKVVTDQIKPAELTTLRSLLASMGLSPSDRAKLSVPVEAPHNEFSELIDGSEIHDQVQ